MVSLRGQRFMPKNEENKPGRQADQGISISARGVTKQFGSNIAVNNVSFDVHRGEVIGFLGPNGSGKSTTMRLITSYYTPDTGTIQIEGIDNQKDDKATRGMIGYLPENNPLYGDLLVHQYLNYVADLRGLTKADRRANLEMAVTETGIEEVFYKPISTCSKGYRQRTGLAGAILHQPKILIMDEPTEGLDPNQRVPIRELIRKMGEERTVMLSTHVLQEVEEVCDRLLIIRKGIIVEEGTPTELRGRARSQSYFVLEVEGNGVRSAVDAMDIVRDVVPVGQSNGRGRYHVTATDPDMDIRPELYKLVKQHDWMLWELHEEDVSLSELFATLTRDEIVGQSDDSTPSDTPSDLNQEQE